MGAGSDSDEDFERLLLRVRAGERTAWDALYRRYAPAALGYLRSQRAEGDEDLLGDVWLQVVRDLPRFEGGALQFRGWLLQITHHRLLDRRRVGARRSEIIEQVAPEPVVEDDHAFDQFEEDAINQVERLLDGLPDNQRAVLYLRYVMDLTQREIAVIMGSSTAAVKMLQMRGVRAAARRLSDEDREAGSNA